MDEDIYGNVLIVVMEVVNNVILYGVFKSDIKNVCFFVRIDEKEVCFIVLDDGFGFDYFYLLDFIVFENLEKEFGRGVFLMCSLVDDVKYNDCGNFVDIVFYCV